jgi:paraquat-inducible protein B
MPDVRAEPGPVPESRAVPRKKTRLSLVWVVPIVAALVGVWVAATKIMSEGPKITIEFGTAEGLEAGKTKVHYNGVDVGTVTTIRLSDDHRHVITEVEMAPKTESMLVEDTRFWVVRPRISGANVTGLGTLISGAYLGMEIGKSDHRKREFVALATPPVVARATAGRFFDLRAKDLGSLDYGTPIYFRRLQVGEIASYALDPDGHSLNVKVFVNEPYDRFVTAETRFWHASGIDMSLSASGLVVDTQSAMSILVGGVAFETPATHGELAAADADTVFTLFEDRAHAFMPPRGEPQTYALVLRQSVRGLVPGAPVELRGIPIGEVADMRSQFDPKTMDFAVLVSIDLYPQMFGVGGDIIDLSTPAGVAAHRQRLDALIAHGLRAQIKSGSLLTGALYVAFDFFADQPAVMLDWSRTPVEIPVIPGELEAVEATLVKIVHKFDKIPLEKIGDDVAKALVQLDQTLASGRRTLDTADGAIGPDSSLRVDLTNTLQEVSRAARAIRVLGDYLERHPEALIRGKPGEAK